MYMQKFLGVNRIKGISADVIAYGANWFSITGDFVKYIVE